jgi:hypothetical protein
MSRVVIVVALATCAFLLAGVVIATQNDPVHSTAEYDGVRCGDAYPQNDLALVETRELDAAAVPKVGASSPRAALAAHLSDIPAWRGISPERFEVSPLSPDPHQGNKAQRLTLVRDGIPIVVADVEAFGSAWSVSHMVVCQGHINETKEGG